MKTIIEYMPSKANTSARQDEAIEFIFYNILEAIANAYNEEALRKNMNKAMKECTCANYCGEDIFEYGFGANHMWVSQYLGVEAGKKVRNLFIEF